MTNATLFDPAISDENFIPDLGNRFLRFGQHNEDVEYRGSLNGASGSLWGPEVYYPSEDVWRRGTYSYENFVIALAVGGDDSNIWNLNGSPEVDSYYSDDYDLTFSDDEDEIFEGFNYDDSNLFDARTEGALFSVDVSGLRSGIDGSYGSFSWTGYYTLTSDAEDVDIELIRSYEFGSNDKFFKETTTIKNIDDNNELNNVRFWYGVSDDYAGLSDSNDKLKGNLSNGRLDPISSIDDQRYQNDNQNVQSSLILNGGEIPGVSIDLDETVNNVPVNILYTPSSNGYAIIAEEYGWDDFDNDYYSIGRNPLDSDSVFEDYDGGYAIYYKIGNLAPGESASVETLWGMSFIDEIAQDLVYINNGPGSSGKIAQAPISLDEDESNEIIGSSSDDHLLGAGSLDIMRGGSGNDYLKAKDNNDILIGGSGNDSLYGGKDNDELIGGSGSDILGGGKGDDILVGGSNADTFKISKGNDLIRDFSIDQNDRIDANGYNLEFMQDGINLLISDSENDVLTTVLNLNRDDFLAWQPELMG